MDATLAPPLPARTGAPTRVGTTLGSVARWVGSRIVGFVRQSWDPRFRVLTAPLAALSIVSALATCAAPWLIRWPLLLALLSPRIPFLMLAAPGTPTMLFVVLGTLRLCVADPFYFVLGRRMGDAGIVQERTPVWLRHHLDRFGTSIAFVAVLVRPISRHLLVAGAVRSRPIPVAIGDVLSTMVFLLAIREGLSLF